MNKTIKYLIGFAISDAILWLALSPRIATKLYHSKLFKKEGERGDMELLRNFDEVETSELFVPACDGTPLHAWFFKHPTSKKVFLYNMGRSSDLGKSLNYSKIMLDAGGSVFVYEYRGFGSTPGAPSVLGICQDGLTAYDYVHKTLGYDPKDIVIYGESLGAGVASYIAKRRKSAGYVLQSGFASLERIGKEMVSALKVYPRWLFPTPALDNAEVAAGPHPPLLVIHGIKDDVIPVHHSRLIFDGASEPKQLVHLTNSAHADLSDADPSAFTAALRRFLATVS